MRTVPHLPSTIIEVVVALTTLEITTVGNSASNLLWNSCPHKLVANRKKAFSCLHEISLIE